MAETEQEGVSPATAGGAPLPNDVRRRIWVAAEDLANAIGCTVVNAPPPLTPFKRRPVLAGPKFNLDGDDEGNTWPNGVGWALSFGCQLSFGRDEETGEPTVSVSMSDEDLRRGITSRTAKRHQVAEFARLLVEQFGEPASSFDAAVEQAVDRVCADQRAEIERLRKERADVADQQLKYCGGLVNRIHEALGDDRRVEVANRGGLANAVLRLAYAFSGVTTERDRLREALAEMSRGLNRQSARANEAKKGIEHWQRLAEQRWQQLQQYEDDLTAARRVVDLVTAERDRLRAELDSAEADNGEFLQAEATYWRTNYTELKAATKPLAVQLAKYLSPPEPPVGTRFVRPSGGVWIRKDDGWYCPDGDCENCPADWASEVELYVRDATRYLPGVEVVSTDGE